MIDLDKLLKGQEERLAKTTMKFNDVVPATPDGWTIIEKRDDGVAYQKGSLRVIASIAMELDGKHWFHVSVSLSHRLPKWRELREVKDAFVGIYRTAIQVFPPQQKYVNIGDVLHLWCCLDGDNVIPDFSAGGSI